MNPKSRVITTFILLILIGLSFGVAGTLYVQRLNVPTSLTNALTKLNPAPQQADFQELVDVWDRLHSNYINTNINDQALLQGALMGLVAGLGDPYSTYLSATESQKFEDEINGSFEGIGMQVGYKDKQLTVVAPLIDSPAARAGIQAGDQLLKIDQLETAGLTLDEAVAKIRGTSGTVVELTIQRTGETVPRVISITRAKIKVDSVTSKIITEQDKKIAYFQVSSFGPTTARDFRAQAKSLMSQSITGVIVDLRNNPGGYLDQAVDLASIFIDRGPIVLEVDRQGQQKSFDATGDAFWSNQPTVVLVDGGSASASEIVAGALKDTGRATIVGQTTFGKGTVQDYKTLANGDSLKLTVAKWLTPKGQSISDHGIEPDIKVDFTESDVTNKVDPQLDRAKQIIVGQ